VRERVVNGECGLHYAVCFVCENEKFVSLLSTIRVRHEFSEHVTENVVVTFSMEDILCTLSEAGYFL
jgi:hypothetical protein